MLIKEIFEKDVTRDIAPVIYFHEQSPEKLQEEVSEYIITGGYRETDPRYKRMKSGIHEEFVRLLKAIARELEKKEVELPAAWISGFYGSGKSSFAKLLGLALDGVELPDGRSLVEALIARDDSPQAPEFKEAWDSLRTQIDPIAVVFDIGAEARDNEDIHTAVKRQLQKRLGYCPNNYVADFELKLELEKVFQDFLAKAQEVLGVPWSERKNGQMAEEDFSEVMHHFQPERYTDPMSWFDSHCAIASVGGTSVNETTKAIDGMLKLRAPDQTLFIVIDEVSQYIFQNDHRMLKLQSFVADIGQKLKGRVWLFATGQQKLDDSNDESNIGKLKDRFPPKLRVHLDPTNIRDVVHKRLLKKSPTKESALREIFSTHRSDLKLNGYDCASITEEDFVEVYPLLPGYIDLLMQITSALRIRSTRSKGDDYAIRGLLQLLGELFRQQNLADQPLGALVSLDSIFEVQKTALDADTQNTLTRIFSDPDIENHPLAERVVKVISLLELIQEQKPTKSELICQCLYNQLGLGSQLEKVEEALNLLKDKGLISVSEKLGYKIQSSLGQEWQKDRNSHSVNQKEISTIVIEKLKVLIGEVDRPKFKGKGFSWSANYTDNRSFNQEKIQRITDLDTVLVDFQFLGRVDERSDTIWTPRSAESAHLNSLIWVAGDSNELQERTKELARSRKMVSRYDGTMNSLSFEQQRLYFEEQSRCKELERSVKELVAISFVSGDIYFRGRKILIQDYGSTFATALQKIGEKILPEIFSQYVDFAITPKELEQLLEPTLSGVSSKFMSSALGILDLDSGNYQPTCSGEVPSRIYDRIKEENGMGGNNLLEVFTSPPCGYSPDVIKACVIGLLRAGKVNIRSEMGNLITSVKDPGAKDLFTKDRGFKRSEIIIPTDKQISGRDKIKICKFFKDFLDVDLDRENDAIADAVFQYFPSLREQLRELEALYNKLPKSPDLPEVLAKFEKALSRCTSDRHIEPTVNAVLKNLDTLSDGIEQLGIINSEITEEVLEHLKKASEVERYQIAQLEEFKKLAEVKIAAEKVIEQLSIDRPWRGIKDLEKQCQEIKDYYILCRQELLNFQEQEIAKAKEEIKLRSDFSTLSADQSNAVLRPITLTKSDTTKNDLFPSLVSLGDSFLRNIQEAKEKAHKQLDEILSRKSEKSTPLIAISITNDLKNRELSNEEELEAFLEEIKERLKAELKNNVRLRII